MSVTLQQECAEAIDAALFETGFEALGNSEGGRVDWWHRGDSKSTKQIKVSVARGVIGSYVVVTAEWPHEIGREFLKGTVNWTIPCDGTVTKPSVIEASTTVVIKVLELFRDILEGKAPKPTKLIDLEKSYE